MNGIKARMLELRAKREARRAKQIARLIKAGKPPITHADLRREMAEREIQAKYGTGEETP